MAECHARLMVVAKHGTPEAFSATLAGVLQRAELSISNAYDAGAKSIQVEAIGACGVSGPLIGQPQAMPDLSQLTERGAVAWAGVDAQGLRDCGASPSANAGEPRNAIDRDALIDAIAQGLHGTWHCTRVWEAWHVGTMSQDDFKPVDESETPTEIADAVLALLAAPPTAQAEGWTKTEPLIARWRGEWHEDDGSVVWWSWNGHGWAGESPWCGTPLDSDWPGYHTHWTPAPPPPTSAEGVGS